MSLVSLIILSVLIVVFCIIVTIPVISGAVKKRNVIKPVEYFPPRGASPVDILIQYYGKYATLREIFNPLMLYWAERGFITIEEDCKRGLKLTKLKDIERPESDDGFNAQTFEIEKKLFYAIFNRGEKNVPKNDVFYTLTAPASFKKTFEEITETCRNEAKKVNAAKSKRWSFASIVLSFFMMVSVIVTVGINVGGMAMMLVFPTAAVLMGSSAFSSYGEPDMPAGSAMKFFCIPFFLMFGGVPLAMFIMLAPITAGVSVIAAMTVFTLNVVFISKKIDVRTDEQLKYYARICGFKHFLLLAEAEQLEAMVEENPRYYYDILPYCYVLKITEKLKPKFDRIALDGPAWYLGELRETLMF